MSKGRLEAFSDGVIAIIITIMVLNLKIPTHPSFAALAEAWPVLVSYVLSYTFVGIYWNNHHHLLQAAEHVSGGVLWANLHLLFWISLVPFLTAWLGAYPSQRAPLVCYGAVLFCAALAYTLLKQSLVRHHAPGSPLVRALGRDIKGRLSLLLYLVAILAAFLRWPLAAYAVYISVAMMWFIPDRRIERSLEG